MRNIFPDEIKRALIDDDLVDLKDQVTKHDTKIDWKDDVGYTPLMYAISLGRTDIRDYLIRRKANPLSRSKYNDSPLSIALRNFDEDSIKKLLLSYIEKKADCNDSSESLEELKSHTEDELEDLLLYFHSVTDTNSAQLLDCFKSENPKLILECHKEARDACEYLGIETW